MFGALLQAIGKSIIFISERQERRDSERESLRLAENRRLAVLELKKFEQRNWRGLRQNSKKFRV